MLKGITVNANCSNISSLPEIGFTIDEQYYPLAGTDYVLQIEQAGQKQCVLGLQSMEFPAGFDYFIVGDVFMRKYPTYFNLNDNTVSFMVANTIA
jgi:hypothetical protein